SCAFRLRLWASVNTPHIVLLQLIENGTHVSNPRGLTSLKRIEPPAKRHGNGPGWSSQNERGARFAQSFGTSDDAWEIESCAPLVHICATRPWWFCHRPSHRASTLCCQECPCAAACSPTIHH